MNFTVDYIYRLAPRGGAGLACDETGVALGAADLARVHIEAGSRRRCEVRPPGDVSRVLKAAYGAQPDAVVQRLHRGLNRTARWLEAGDLGHAGIEAVMLGFPDLTPTAMAKLAEIADLEKRGAAWGDEPRVPAGQAGGGQWTTGGGGGAAASGKDVQTAAPSPKSTRMPRHEPRAQVLEDRVYGPAAASPASSPYTQPPQAALDDGVLHFAEGQGPGEQPTILDDGVYRPASNRPRLVSASGPLELELERLEAAAAARAEAEAAQARAAAAAAEAAEARAAAEAAEQRSPRLPGEVKTVEDLFPRLQEHPKELAPFRSPDRFGVAGYADILAPANQEQLYLSLKAETKAVDRHYNSQGLPKGEFARLSEADRARLIDDVLMDRAAAYYKINKDPTQLQIETLRFLRKTVNHYYAEAVEKADAKRLDVRPSRNTVIGKYMDGQTRRDLQHLFNLKGIPYGPGQGVAINNRDYDTSQSGKPPYRVPDLRIGRPQSGDSPIDEVRIGNLAIDWTISIKRPEDAQIQGFFKADSKPKGVLIVVPSQRYDPGAYYIPRAASVKVN